MKAVQFELGHLDLLNEDIISASGVTVERIRELALSNPDDVMMTFIDKDRIVCISGIVEVWEGVGEAYNLLTKYLEPMHARGVKKEFDIRIGLYDRIQTHSEAGTYERWHELLGFSREGYLKKYMDGKDYILWARVSEG